MEWRIGSSSRIINPEPGANLMGQLFNRVSRKVRDNLEANVLYLSDGKTSVFFISCDLALLENDFITEVSAEIEKVTSVPADAIIIGCTHTHAGPYTTALLPDVPGDDAYLQKLKTNLVEACQEALQKSAPGILSAAAGKAQIGYNRRLCWADGTHSMYGDSRRPDFTGLEGPDDSQQIVLAAYDKEGKCQAIMHNNSCHATSVESADFVSADFPGAARYYLRQALGRDIPVLYLQGASGDTSPWDMLHPEKRVPGSQRCQEIGLLLAGTTLHLLKTAQQFSEGFLSCLKEELKVKIRLPTAQELEKARETVKQGEKQAGRWNYVLAWSVLALYEKFHQNPEEVLPVHAIRIGPVAVVTNPCELFCHFGLEIKRRSPAQLTMVAQLVNGFSGYCPTIPGIIGGGYSGMTILWTRLEPYAGYMLVETSARLLHQLWKK